jgi:hypothetical protein
MYTVCTRTMVDALRLPYLDPIPDAFVWVALVAWAATFLGLVHRLVVPPARSSSDPAPPGAGVAA